jgi:hypothetical protein
MSDANSKNAGGDPPEAASEQVADAGLATGEMTAPPQAAPKGSFPRTAKLAAADAAPAPAPAPAERRAVPATALIQQPELRTAHDADPSTLRDANPPWQRPGNTEVGEPPLMDTVPPAAPPAPLAPPVAFAPLPTPNVPMAHATPPINAAPAYGAPAYYAPRRPRGNGMLLIGAGLFGFVLLLGSAVAIVLWMRQSEDEAAPALAPSSAPAQVTPEVATVEPQVTPEPPPPVPAPVEPAPEPRPAARKPRPPAAPTPAATPDPPALPAPPVEPAPPAAEAPPPTPTETAEPAPPAPPAETLPTAPAPRRRVPGRIGR